MENQKKEQVVLELINTYANDSEVCMDEMLASEAVPSGTTYKEAFEIYIEAMKRIEGDTFYTIKDGEKIEL